MPCKALKFSRYNGIHNPVIANITARSQSASLTTRHLIISNKSGKSTHRTAVILARHRVAGIVAATGPCTQIEIVGSLRQPECGGVGGGESNDEDDTEDVHGSVMANSLGSLEC